MNIKITARQMTVRESLKELIARKLAKFDKFFGEDTVADVKCSVRNNEQRIEITISYGGTLFRSEQSDETFNNALDSAMLALERQIRKNKTRLEKRLRENAFVPADDDVSEGEENEFVVHRKTFEIRPMTEEEAILQMNLIGHQFFMFFDAEIGKTCTVYRRDDGEYGLIIPA